MITRQEYIKALDTVEMYHKQLFEKYPTKTPLRKWSKLNECSTRLRRGLIALCEYSEEYNLNYTIENLKKKNFIKTPRLGCKSWIEFVILRGY